MCTLYIKFENVCDLEIFVKGNKSKREVGRLQHAYQKHLSRLEKCSDGESFEEEVNTDHQIRLYLSHYMLEWVQSRDIVIDFGRVVYSPQDFTEVLLAISILRIPIQSCL